MNIRSVFRSLKYPNYRLFFAGQSISLVGTWVQRMALPWLVYSQTKSVFMLGFVTFMGQIPTFLLAPFAGVLSDRFNRYYMLIGLQTLAMAQAIVLAILVLTNRIELWQIIALSGLLGCINAFDIPTRQSFVVKMVNDKADLSNAIALNSSMVNGAKLLGPSIAGILIATVGEGYCFLINAISYVFVILSLLLMKIGPIEKRLRKTNLFSDLKDGFSYAFGFIPICYIILLLALVSIMSMPYLVLMPVIAKEMLHGTSLTYGFLMGASGAGALAGALYLASRKSVLGLGKIIPMATFILSIGIIGFAFSRNVYISIAFLVITGLGLMLQLASSNTIIQTIVAEDKRGRVMSIYTMAFMGTAPFGSFMAGSLAKLIGASFTLLIGGLVCMAGAVLFYLKLPEIRRNVRPIYISLGVIKEGN